MGVNIVEREGISHSHPARFILVGTMNPEEGDLRPQLLDRFAFSVNIKNLPDMRARVAIMERRIGFETDAAGFQDDWAGKEAELGERIAAARAIVQDVTYSRRDLASIAGLTATMHVDGHRGDIVILRGAQANAAFHNRTYITNEDIIRAAELALPHRMKSSPFQDTGDVSDLADRLEEAQQAIGEDEFSDQESMNDDQAPPDGEKKTR